MKRYHQAVLFTTLLTLSVIVAGAWVRLTDAGLGCPDWPGCYGQLLVPEAQEEIDRANSAFPERPVETGKAWREMIHRYMASLLGLCIVGLAVAALIRRKRDPLQPVVIPVLLVFLVIFQGMLGMWTVTLLLKPLIVMGHLIGGMTTLSLLVWLAWQTRYPEAVKLGSTEQDRRRPMTRLATIGLGVLFVQLMLGGWTSTNYAAMSCPDFPTCQNQWLPAGADYAEGFVLWRGLGVDYEGGVLEHPARVAIHFVHRLGAIVTTIVLLWMAIALMRVGGPPARRSALATKVFLAAQIAIGIIIIKLALPLSWAVAHNGNAALLLIAVISANFCARRLPMVR
ncbi:MAG: COX15/CtaA family protein [Pseudomonadota bacterium]